MMTSRVRPQRSTSGAYIRAELVRMKRTAEAWFPLIGFLMGAIFVVLSRGASISGFETAAFSWQTMYFTGIAGPMMMLLAAMPEARDKTARFGGLHWRDIDMRKVQAARLAGASLVAFAFHLLSYGVIAVAHPAAFAKSGIAFLFTWLGSLGMLYVGAGVARAFGVAGAVAVGIVWQILGGIFVESTWWWIVPMTWPIRVLLRPIGVNYNGTPIDPDSSAAQQSPLVAAAACAVFAVIAFTAVSLTAHRGEKLKSGWIMWMNSRIRHERPEQSGHSLQTGETQRSFIIANSLELGKTNRNPRIFPIQALWLATKGSGAVTLTVLACLTVLMTGWLYHGEVATEFYSYAIFPLGVGLLPLLTWRVMHEGFMQLRVENPRISTAFVALLVVVIEATVLVTTAVHWFFRSEKEAAPMSTSISEFFLWSFVGVGLMAVSLAICVRFNYGMSIAATMGWTVIALTLGGDALVDTFLWLAAPSAWAVIGVTGSRLFLALSLSFAGMIFALITLRFALRNYVRRTT